MPSASARRSAAARFSTGFTTTFPEAFYFTGGIAEIRARSASLPHAQHLLLNGHSLQCHPTTGWNILASIARSTSAAIRNSRTFAARSRVVQYQWSSGCLVFVSTSKTCGNREQWWHAWARAVGYVSQRALQERPGGFGGSRNLNRSVTPFAPEAPRPRPRWQGITNGATRRSRRPAAENAELGLLAKGCCERTGRGSTKLESQRVDVHLAEHGRYSVSSPRVHGRVVA